MNMTISTTRPPIWDKAHEHFDIDDARTVYTYGNTLHNPADLELDEFLLTHEGTHAIQQADFPGGAAAWWEKYFDNTTFRAYQEAEAYGQQYRHYCEVVHNRDLQARYLHELAGFLASGMYKASMLREDARKAIVERSMRKRTLSPVPFVHSPAEPKPERGDWL